MSVADRVLDGLGPTFRGRAGALLTPLVTGLVTGLQYLADHLEPTDRGWPKIFDLDQTPAPRWLGRAIGTSIPAGLDDTAQRDYLRDRPDWRRGSVDALAAAIRTLLDDPARVGFVERPDGDAWRLRILIHADDIGDVTEAQVLAAAATQKPIGLVIDGVDLVVDDEDPPVHWWRPSAQTTTYARLSVLAPTYADLAAMFPTYADARDHNPQEA